MTDSVLFETDGNIAVITLNRPDRRNAVNADLADALTAAIDRLETDPALDVGVLAGNGKVFCAGMDLAAFADGQQDAILNRAGGFGGLTERARTKPLIAVVHGAALAGGFELAIACDLIVAEEGARFGVPEVIRGLIAGAGGALRLAELVPQARAREILLTGRLFDTAEAWDLGLLSRRCAAGQARDAALQLAREIAANAPLAVRGTLATSKLLRDIPAGAAWAENTRLLKTCLDSQDALEGARAFLERRAPVWTGK
ncbi:crotonase/enoyl-CoA hydratase family protein [Gemmobacter sp.]|uniref:crotonase/enoyl-CoA hydratase family protein n=1 Tax=Gemmobacter sp. TaxID=1898957 RepID=UPI002AFE62AB|nr:crotonase/enoyl-CoA hydratase family protein [Gemmobacter sp.]